MGNQLNRMPGHNVNDRDIFLKAIELDHLHANARWALAMVQLRPINDDDRCRFVSPNVVYDNP